tara:strand:- start:3557 stop:4882 length:1326 start_codon:yes stop_codon:yes gene_type:complete
MAAITETRNALKDRIYLALTSEDDGRVCRDIPESACNHQPKNFLIHVLSLGATKTGDGLVDPKLVLSWLLGALGAPTAAIGMLVPVREAGALLPQLFTAASIRRLPQRKWVWAAGSLVQGLSLAAMAATVLLFDGATAGWMIVALLAVFAVARSACSVAYKDVLGKTVSKATRGTATGTAGTVGAVTVFLFGAALSTGLLDKSVTVLCGALALGGVLWIVAALLFTTLDEAPGATEGGGNPLRVAREQFGLLRRDAQLVRFIVTRGLLIATALAPPYLLAIAGRDGEKSLGALGPFVLASAFAAILSTYVWGRLSDRSSRRVLGLSGMIAAAILAAAAGVAGAGGSWLQNGFVLPVLLFGLMIAYQGVRIGRSTHLVDMADENRRAAYTALSNTIIGVVLVAGGVFGIVADIAGIPAVLGIFALMSAGAVVTAYGLDEVQQ